MFVYIDALFNTRTKQQITCFQTEQVWEHVTVDDPGVRDIPPYRLIPESVSLALADGTIYELDGTDLVKLYKDLDGILTVLYAQGNVQFVGWYLDQTVFPSLCANAMSMGCKFPPYLFRKLSDKWAKTEGLSLERAFHQGWYPESNGLAIAPLTLDEALTMCGLSTVATIESNLAAEATCKNIRLMARLSAISRLHTRYDMLTNRSV